jgi:hypothetical protein
MLLKRQHWIAVVAGSLGVTGFILTSSPGTFLSATRETNEEDIFFYFAQQLGEPALCNRIRWSVFERYNVTFGGGGASYMRSDCYERVAQTRHDASICWKVRPLVEFSWVSPGYSTAGCRRRTLARENVFTALDDALLVRTFERMGYDIARMPTRGVFPPPIRLPDVYRGLEHDSAAVARAGQLLRPPGPARAGVPEAPEDRNYLAHLVAVARADPGWCDEIDRTSTESSGIHPFHEWCLYTLAQNAGSSQICARMRPAAEDRKTIEAKAHGVRPAIAEQLSLRADCESIERNRALAPTNIHYSPELPPGAVQIRRVLDVLGVAIPPAHDWPIDQRATYLNHFLFALSHESYAVGEDASDEAARVATREELVRRMLALPSGSL